MRLIPTPLEISPDDGFNEQKDLLGRAEFARRITNLVKALEHPAVLVLDAPWGAGKTTFVRMWQGHLSKEKIPSIYFDAFSSDYMTDPFLALTGEILSLAEEKIPSEKGTISRAWDVSKSVGKVVLKHGANAALRIATLSAIDANTLGDAGTDIEKAISEKSGAIAEEIIKERLEKRKEERATFDKFREILRELSSALTKEAGDGGPLILIIDELDRCKPTFALSLLESIKHFFDVDGIVVLLVTNLKQLSNTVKFAYGNDIDADTYLEKFYHIIFSMPPMPHEVYIDRLLAMASSNADKDARFASGLKTTLIEISKRRNYTLRRLERIATSAIIFLASEGRVWPGIAPVIAGLCAIRAERPDLYNLARHGQLDIKEARKIVGFGEAIGGNDIVAKWWAFIAGGGMVQQDIYNLEELITPLGHSRENVLQYLCSVLDGFSLPNSD